MSQWTDVTVRAPKPEGVANTPEVNLCRFHDNGDVGIVVNDAVYEDGKNVFPAQAFVNALWELYPDGLPPRVEEISEEEAEVRRLSIIFLNGLLVDAGSEPFGGTYQEAESLWHFTLKKARKAAEGYVAALKNDED